MTSSDWNEKVTTGIAYTVLCTDRICTHGRVDKTIVLVDMDKSVVESYRLQHVNKHREHERFKRRMLDKFEKECAGNQADTCDSDAPTVVVPMVDTDTGGEAVGGTPVASNTLEPDPAGSAI